LRIENREYIQKMYQYRYQRNFKNLVLFGLSIFGKDKARHYKNYIGLQLCLFFANFGLDSLVNYFRNFNPKKELEKIIGTIMKTRFMALDVAYPGAALDIDNAKDYDAMKNRFDEWWKYLQEYKEPVAKNYIEVSPRLAPRKWRGLHPLTDRHSHSNCLGRATGSVFPNENPSINPIRGWKCFLDIE